MNSTTGSLDTTELIAVADQLATSLAGDALMCGPAAPQDDASALILADDLRGVDASFDDGTKVVVLATVLGAGRIAGTDEPSAVVGALRPSIESIASSTGRSVVSAEPIIDAETVRVALGRAPGAVLVGAGIFDGDQAIAAVAVQSASAGTGPADAGRTSGVDAFDGPVDAPSPQAPRPSTDRNLRLLADVTLGVTAELGTATMTMGELLDLQPGGVIELDREAGAPIDVLVNGTLIARGEVVVVDSQYAVRIAEVVSESDHP